MKRLHHPADPSTATSLPARRAPTAAGRPPTGSLSVARASDGDRDPAVELDQYYTRPDIAEQLYRVFKRHFDPDAYQMIEPSAGTGSFFRLLPAGSLGYDVEPKYPGITMADFLTVEIAGDRDVAVIGNPPFGKNASTAVRFFNYAARRATVIAMIFPRTFRKFSIQNRLDRRFHLVHEEPVPANAFLFRSRPCHVPVVFQIWDRRTESRDMRPAATRHPDFAFTTPDRADFAIHRVGARAGGVHRNFRASANSNYFISGNVEPVIRQLDLAGIAANVAGNPSVSKAEIVWMYDRWIGAQAGRFTTQAAQPAPRRSRCLPGRGCGAR